VLEWRNSAGSEGVDLSAILVTSSGQVRSDADLVFFNQSSSADGSVGHLVSRAPAVGPAMRSVSGCRPCLVMSPRSSLPPASMVMERSATSTTCGSCCWTPPASCLLRYDLGRPTTERAILVGELYRRAGDWKLRAIGRS